jgi:acylphosphatase
MAELAGVTVVVTGLVQGVLFRDFVRQHARRLGLNGYVRNMPGGRAVELEAEGERAKLEALVAQVKKGPPQAVVEKAEVTWGKPSGRYSQFEIKY